MENLSVSIIVPCYNEEKLIQPKIANLLEQDYKGEVDITIVDGGSTDDTFRKVIQCYIPNKVVTYIAHKGKTNQLNLGLCKAKGDIVVITDVDAIMEPDSLSKVIAKFKDLNVAVVGPCSVPYKAKFLDPIAWRISNFIRMVQANRVTAPWVIGTFYAFRRGLLEQFPEDVIADDCYIALYANFKGFKSLYIGDTVVKEIRNPYSWSDFIMHKHRKANALLREFTRFSYKMAYARPGWKCLFIGWFIFLLIVAGWSYPFFKQDSSFRRV